MIVLALVFPFARPPPLRASRPATGRVPSLIAAPLATPPVLRPTRPPSHFAHAQPILWISFLSCASSAWTLPPPACAARPPDFMPPTCLMPSRSSLADFTLRLMREFAVSAPPVARGFRSARAGLASPATLPPRRNWRREIGRGPVDRQSRRPDPNHT